MSLRVLSWNLYHGRDFPPDPALLTWRSRILRITERNDTHAQVNRDLLDEFASFLAGADWDVALLQECPPRWCDALARATGAEAHRSLTSRNSLAPIRAALARLNPDLIASNEGGSNLTLVRPAAGSVAERRELVVRTGPRPERRTMGFARLESGTCVANLHASGPDPMAAEDLLKAASRAVEWARRSPLVLGGDFNLRPRDSAAYDELARRHGFTEPSEPGAIDHVLARGLRPVEGPRSWPAQAREVPGGGLAIRLSDHAPVEALFAAPPGPGGV